MGSSNDAKGIDAYISLALRDLPQAPAGLESFVVTAPGSAASTLSGLEGVEVQGDVFDGGIEGGLESLGTSPLGVPSAPSTNPDSPTIAVRADPTGNRSMLESAEVQRVQSTARSPKIPVLLHLRKPNWDRDIPGLEKGSRLGRVMSAMADATAIQALADDPDIISVEASRDGVLECATSMPWIGVPQAHAAPYGEKGAGAIVGVIDDGIDVLHEAFQDAAGASRILYVWDQRDGTGPTPKAHNAAVYDQDYGTLHTRSEISGYIQAGAPGKLLGRNNRTGHGTHVASIAAGSPFSGPSGAFPGGVAPAADIVVVIPKLGADSNEPQSLGYSKTHVDALAFLRATADEARKPVAVNVSLGMNAGAHDGTSLLELAFDDFSGGGRDPGYVVVKSAGNEFGHDGHAYAQAFEGGVIPIEWTTKANPRREDYLEFWFRSCDDLAFTLHAPNGLSCRVDRATSEAKAQAGAIAVYLKLTRFHTDNGDSRLVVLARNNLGLPLTEAGDWRLDIAGTEVFSEGGVHGWVERNDARAVSFATGSANDLTLSIPATARTVIAVGACAPRNPLALSDSSSRGPTRDARQKPELVAPGVGIVAARAGTTGGMVAMTGTSMAAPHVTGAVALLLSRRQGAGQPQLNAAQVRAALSESLGSYNGRWQPGFGNGRLDVVKLLTAFG